MEDHKRADARHHPDGWGWYGRGGFGIAAVFAQREMKQTDSGGTPCAWHDGKMLWTENPQRVPILSSA